MAKHTETTPSMESLIGIDEAATIVGLRRSTLYAHTSNRTIPHYKRGGKLYFRHSELLAWLTQGYRPVIDSSTAEGHLSKQRGGK